MSDEPGTAPPGEPAPIRWSDGGDGGEAAADATQPVEATGAAEGDGGDGGPTEVLPTAAGDDGDGGGGRRRAWLLALVLLLGIALGVGVALILTQDDDDEKAAVEPKPAITKIAPTTSTVATTTTVVVTEPTTVPPAPPGGGSTGGGSTGGGSTGGGSTGGGTVTPTNPPATAAPTGPVITSFTSSTSVVTCSPQATFQSPSSVTLSWTTQNATGVDVSIDGPGVFGSYGPQGSDSFPVACDGNTHTYTLTAKGSGGQTTSKTISVQTRT